MHGRLEKKVCYVTGAASGIGLACAQRFAEESAKVVGSDLNENPNLASFRQTDNGVVLRMALFALVLDVVNLVDKSAKPVNWYTGSRFQ